MSLLIINIVECGCGRRRRLGGGLGLGLGLTLGLILRRVYTSSEHTSAHLGSVLGQVLGTFVNLPPTDRPTTRLLELLGAAKKL